MARRGSFTGSTFPYGQPLSYVHPIDNKMPSVFDPALNDPSLKLTKEQKAQLDAQIDDLYQTLRAKRTYYT